MFPPVPRGSDGDRPGLSFSGIYTRGDRGEILAALGELRFTGWVGPADGAWIIAVCGNPLGKVARGKRRFDDVARDLASTLQTSVIGVEVNSERRLRIVPFDGEDALPVYDSAPPEPDEAQILVDDFGNPMMGEAAFVDTEAAAHTLLRLQEITDDGAYDSLVELLDDDLGESTHESERLVDVLRLLDLPTWIVSSDSLPRNIPGGPAKSEMTRLGAGKPGVQGRVKAAVWKPVRGKPDPSG